jgi:hypothetical protein
MPRTPQINFVSSLGKEGMALSHALFAGGQRIGDLSSTDRTQAQRGSQLLGLQLLIVSLARFVNRLRHIFH